jgi:hypothetical protein
MITGTQSGPAAFLMPRTPPSRDEQDLGHFGYAQELFRSMGGFSNFAISFSIISILTGAVTLYGYGLKMGGPLEMSLGWPIATIFTLLLAASMAELCSAYPTSGAMYHWAAALGGRASGWFVASLNIVGLIAALAGINFSAAQFVLPFLGISPSSKHVFLMFAFTLVVHGLINHFGVRLVALLNNTSVVIHLVGVFAIAGILFWFAPHRPISFLASGSGASGHPYAWAFLLGLLQAHWTYTGFDGSAHMAEETHDPRRVAPWGMVMAVGVSGVVGYILLVAITLDGDVVLRAFVRDVGLARHLLSGARSRNAVPGDHAAGQREARDAGCGDLGHGDREPRGDGVDGCCPHCHFAQHSGVVPGLYHPRSAGVAGTFARIELAHAGEVEPGPMGRGAERHRARLHCVHLFRADDAAESTGSQDAGGRARGAGCHLCVRSAAQVCDSRLGFRRWTTRSCYPVRQELTCSRPSRRFPSRRESSLA